MADTIAEARKKKSNKTCADCGIKVGGCGCECSVPGLQNVPHLLDRLAGVIATYGSFAERDIRIDKVQHFPVHGLRVCPVSVWDSSGAQQWTETFSAADCIQAIHSAFRAPEMAARGLLSKRIQGDECSEAAIVSTPVLRRDGLLSC